MTLQFEDGLPLDHISSFCPIVEGLGHVSLIMGNSSSEGELKHFPLGETLGLEGTVTGTSKIRFCFV